MSNALSEDYLEEDELCAALDITTRTARNWRQRRVGPPWVKPTKKLIVYPRRGFKDWLDGQTVRPVNGGHHT